MCHSGGNSGIYRIYPASYLLDEWQNMLFYGRKAYFGIVEIYVNNKELSDRPENFLLLDHFKLIKSVAEIFVPML